MAGWRLAVGLMVGMAVGAGAQDVAPVIQAAPPPPPPASGVSGAVVADGQMMAGDVRMGPREPQGPTGGVTGRVVAADTQQAARFATVVLVPVASVQQASGSGRFFGVGGGSSGRTDLDGNFTITNVPVGDYYVTAQATGYVNTMSLVLAQAAQTGQDPAGLMGRVPQVHVNAGAPSNVSVQIDRGGVIAGKLVWDDNTPAAGVQVSALTDTASTTTRSGFGFGGSGYAMTDDRGQFRINGLAPGTYLVRASVQSPVPGGAGTGFMRSTSVQMYSPGKVRRTDAKAITLGQAEERDDVMFVMDLHSLHAVSGRVAATSGVAVESGLVRLTDSVDTTLVRMGYVGTDGSFTVPYVPAGTYTLSVMGRARTRRALAGGAGVEALRARAGRAFSRFRRR